MAQALFFLRAQVRASRQRRESTAAQQIGGREHLAREAGRHGQPRRSQQVHGLGARKRGNFCGDGVEAREHLVGTNARVDLGVDARRIACEAQRRARNLGGIGKLAAPQIPEHGATFHRRVEMRSRGIDRALPRPGFFVGRRVDERGRAKKIARLRNADQRLERRALGDEARGSGTNRPHHASQRALVRLQLLPRHRRDDEDRQVVEVVVGGAQVDGGERKRVLHERGELVAWNESELAVDQRGKVGLQERQLAELRLEAKRRGRHRPHGRQGLELARRGKARLNGCGVDVVQVILVLLLPGFEKRTRALAQAGGERRFGADFATHHVHIEPAQRPAVEAQHRKRQRVLQHAGAHAVEEDFPCHASSLGVGVLDAGAIGVGNERERGGLDDVAVAHRALSVERGRIRRGRVGAVFDGAQRQHEQAAAVDCTRGGQHLHAELRIELRALRQRGDGYGRLRVDVDDVAARRDADAGFDDERRAVRRGLCAEADHQAADHAGADRLREVRLARTDVVLVRGQVVGGEKAAVEVERAAAAAVDDHRAGAQLRLQSRVVLRVVHCEFAVRGRWHQVLLVADPLIARRATSTGSRQWAAARCWPGRATSVRAGRWVAAPPPPQ